MKTLIAAILSSMFVVTAVQAKPPADPARREACAEGWPIFMKAQKIHGKEHRFARADYMAACEARVIEPPVADPTAIR